MTQPRDFYTSQINLHTTQLKKLRQKLVTSSMMRLAVFIAIIAGIYFGYESTQIVIGSILIGIALFLFLITRHSKLSYHRDKYQKLIAINQLELDILDGKEVTLASGEEFIDPLHPFAQDVDLYGERSFFQHINRTAIASGKQKLAQLLGANDTTRIKEKQKAIQDLKDRAVWRQEFSAIAALVKTTTSIQVIKDWLQNYKPFTTAKTKYIPIIVTIISVTLLFLVFTELAPMSLLVIWLFVGLTITGTYLKKINVLYNYIGKSKDTFDQYHRLIENIEETTFTSSLLKEKRAIIYNEQQKASKIVKELASILNALDQRNNMLFGFLGNGFLLWDVYQCYRIERWIEKYDEDVEAWFDVIAFFDAYNSLANYAFNRPSYCYPEITEGKTVIEAKALGHPMLNPEKRVDNDVKIDKEQFFIITGANMAGKSTFLRTISLQIIMANSGLPVCAEMCKYRPIKLYTSMRTTDSLSDDSSYFFSELTQLKRIVDALKTEEYFIILDEILKGTNSKDKAEGSRKFVEKLVKAAATGIIATHDLSLCEIAEEIPSVKNRYFDAQIINDELYFDYTFKDGICQNMNASFLLTKMEII